MSLTASSAYRFALTGGIVTLLHIAIAVALIERLTFHPSLANGLAFIVSNCLSYIINTHWSFQSKPSLKTWWRFIFISFNACALTVMLTWFVDIFGGHHLFGIGLVITIIPTITFFAHRYFTYSPVHDRDPIPGNETDL